LEAGMFLILTDFVVRICFFNAEDAEDAEDRGVSSESLRFSAFLCVLCVLCVSLPFEIIQNHKIR
ncbi:hypothetical protein QUF72_02140, partial [Desulfobacterales bacterium HSG2]|nr:hypothetical protein [Desulfobacterales bacterium HSG2]